MQTREEGRVGTYGLVWMRETGKVNGGYGPHVGTQDTMGERYATSEDLDTWSLTGHGSYVVDGFGSTSSDTFATPTRFIE